MVYLWNFEEKKKNAPNLPGIGVELKTKLFCCFAIEGLMSCDWSGLSIGREWITTRPYLQISLLGEDD